MMSVAISTNTEMHNDTSDHNDTSAQVSLSPGPIAGPELETDVVNNPLLLDDDVEYDYDDIGTDEINCDEDREMLMEENDAIIDEMRQLEKKLDKGVVVTAEVHDSQYGHEEDDGNNNEEIHRRKRVWSIDLGRFLDCDDTSIGDLTSHHDNSVTQETSVELPPIELEHQQNPSSTAVASAAAVACDEIDMDEHAIIHDEIDCKDIVEHLQEGKSDETIPIILQANPRDRGLSFEIFASFHDDADIAMSARKMSFGSNFDFNSDTPVNGTRPRGDSILFDNCNFNATDSITEENALTTELLTRRRGFSITSLGEIEHDKNNDIIVPLEAVSSTQINNTSVDQLTAEPQHTNGIVDNTYNQQQQHHFSTTTDTVATAANNSILPSVAMCQMELLNKGGRIGIYLPEARKARIAKFHSKRKLRIWRKRIKYDCRKKLADSRPRIKGRFVKRIDVEESAADTTNDTCTTPNQSNSVTSDLVVSN